MTRDVTRRTGGNASIKVSAVNEREDTMNAVKRDI